MAVSRLLSRVFRLPPPISRADRARLARRLAVPILMTAVAACDRTPRLSTVDSLLARDLTLAAAAAPSQVPLSLSDTAASPPRVAEVIEQRTPRQTAPRPPAVTRRRPAPSPEMPTKVVVAPPTPAAPATTEAPFTPEHVGVGAGHREMGTGTTLVGRTNSALCSLANRPGDRLVATLSVDAVSADGTTLRAGTPVLVEMSAPTTPGEFAFRVKAVQVDGVLIPIDGSVQVAGATTERRVSKGGDQGKVIGGAIAGAILGRILGGGTKGTVIGAAGGAAAGTIAASRNTVTETCLPSGATLTVRLSAPLVLPQGVP